MVSKKEKPTWKAVAIAMSAIGAGENPAAAEDLAKRCAESKLAVSSGVATHCVAVLQVGQAHCHMYQKQMEWTILK